MMALARNNGPLVLSAALAIVGIGLTVALLMPAMPTLSEPAAGFDIERMVLLYSTLPRAATAILCGAALALAGTILQQVLSNPLASPTTLGISAGAHLALALATLLAPGLLGFGRDAVALCGSAIAALVVFGLTARRGFSPLALVLAGLIVSLYCGALASLLVLLNERYLVSLFIWGAGSLAQQSWHIPIMLLPKLVVLAGIAALAARPLALLGLGEQSASALGLSVATVRVGGLAIAVALSAVVASAVGVIGFVGLVAPTLARLAGARRFRSQLIWSPLIGAALLLATDSAVQWLAGAAAAFLPTGAVTAVFGSPLLLLLLPRLRTASIALDTEPATIRRRANAPWRPIALLIAGLLLLLAIGVFLGRSPDGLWTWLRPEEWNTLLPWRLPRVIAAGAAGAMLAVAGTVLQRMTGNPMASPEILGISAGAALGVAAALFLAAGLGFAGNLGFAAVGALLVLTAILALGRKSGFAPERVLLAGIALTALLDAIVGVLAASGDPRALQLLQWMGGSTYGIEAGTAGSVLVFAALVIPAAFFARRWLDLLPLGDGTALALGLPASLSRGILLMVAAVMTAASTLIVGPLSFVGLMAPHVAREIGLSRALPQMAGAAVAGAGLMVAADWAGRMVAFPYQMPAGLVSALIGAPFLMLLLRRSGRTR